MIDGAGIPPNASELLPELVSVYKHLLACVVDEKTDVYAYGVLLLEIITARPALDESQQSLVMWACYKPLINAKNLERLLDPHLVDAYDLEQLNDMLKPKSVEDVMRVGKMGGLGNGSITGNFALLERNFVQYINSLLQDSGTDFWGTGRFLAHTEKQVASHMDVSFEGSRNFSRGPSFDPLLTESTASDATGQHKFWQKGVMWKTLHYLSSDGNSWVPIPVTSPAETGTSTGTKMTVPSTAEEKTCKKNDVKARSLLLMALPNEHQLTFDHASSSESLDSIFNRLQRLVSRLAILGVVTPPEDLNVKFLRSLPSEWDTHVVVWMNKPDFDTMGLDDLYNNFKIVEQKVKKSAGASNDDKNLAFVTTSGASSTNNINTVNPEVRSQLVHEDLEQLHDDDLEEMDLKWNMALLSMRARKFYQRTRRKIIIDGSNTASSSKAVKIEDASEKAMCAIDGAGFDWSDMVEEEIQANMALMAFSDSEVINDKSCSKSCLKNYEALKKQYDDLLVKLDDTGFKAATYKRGLATLEEQIIKYREHEVLFSEEIALLKRSVGHKEYQMGLLRDELEKVKQEKEGFEFKIAKIQRTWVNEYGLLGILVKLPLCYDKESDNSKENTDDSLEQHQITDTETSSVRPSVKVDKDWKEKFFYHANHIREVEPRKVRENNDAPIIEDWVSDDEDDDEPNPKVEK
ncbi:ribonuclease H-like domain-containing protein [Tanacetum coccineum]